MGSKRLLFVLMTIVVLGALVVSARHGLFDLVNLRAQHDRLVEENEALKTRNTVLLQEIERLKKEKTAMEEVARRDLGLAKPDELVYRFENDKGAGTADERDGSGPQDKD